MQSRYLGQQPQALKMDKGKRKVADFSTNVQHKKVATKGLVGSAHAKAIKWNCWTELKIFCKPFGCLRWIIAYKTVVVYFVDNPHTCLLWFIGQPLMFIDLLCLFYCIWNAYYLYMRLISNLS